MADTDKAIQQMFDMWQQGQESYFKAQKDAFDEFNRAYSGAAMPQSFQMGSEAMQTWQGFVNSWPPAWNPSAMMANDSMSNLFNQGKDALHGMLDPANWMQHAPEQLRNILNSNCAGSAICRSGNASYRCGRSLAGIAGLSKGGNGFFQGDGGSLGPGVQALQRRL